MARAALLVALGALFLPGRAADVIGRRTRLPRVTLLLLCGLAIRSAGLDLLPAALAARDAALSVVALTMAAFLLGSVVGSPSFAAHGRTDT